MINIVSKMKKYVFFLCVISLTVSLISISKDDVSAVLNKLRSENDLKDMSNVRLEEGSVHFLAHKYLMFEADAQTLQIKKNLISKIIDDSSRTGWSWSTPRSRFYAVLKALINDYPQSKDLINKIEYNSSFRTVYGSASRRIQSKGGFHSSEQKDEFIANILRLKDSEFIRFLYIFFMHEVVAASPCELILSGNATNLSNNLFLATFVVLKIREICGDKPEDRLFRRLTETPFSTPPGTPERQIAAESFSRIKESGAVRRALFESTPSSAATQTETESFPAASIATAPGEAVTAKPA